MYYPPMPPPYNSAKNLSNFNNDSPNSNDDLEAQIDKISKSDADLQQQLALLMYPMGQPERTALGLNAYISIDQSHTQLCELRPKHGEYSPEVLRGIFLIQQMSPQAKAEFAADLVLEDWDLGPADDNLAPSTIIE